VLFDAYHAAMAGLDPLEEVARVAPLIGHVPFAVHPGRGAPGTGTLDLGALVDRHAALGYDGAIGLEFLPGGPTPPVPVRD
jgi:hydroxypyruvate isomerase